MNLFDMALGGVNSMAAGRVRDLEEEERLQQQREMIAARYPQRQAQATPFDPETADRNVAYRLGLKKPEDIEGWARGDDLMTEPRQVTPSAANDWKGGEVPPGRPPEFEALVSERLERLAQLRAAERFGDKYDDVAKGELTDSERNRLSRVEKGSRGATVAQLASKGQGEMDNMGGNGTFSKVGGEQRLNDVGKSAAYENNQQGNKAKAEANDVPEKRKRGEGTESRLAEAEERRQAADLRAEIKDIERRLENMKKSDPQRAALEGELAELRREQDALRASRRPGAAGTAPAQSPKPAAAAQLPKSGQSKGGSTWTRND